MKRFFCAGLALILAFFTFSGALAEEEETEPETAEITGEETILDEETEEQDSGDPMIEEEVLLTKDGEELPGDEEISVEKPENRTAQADSASEEGDFPELNGQGFLESGEFVYENDEEGLWRYASETLWVEVRRIIQEKPARTWYEAEIRCAEGGEFPHMIPWNPEKWTDRDYPYKIARTNRTVIAVSSDYAWWRYVKKQRTGIIVRNGELISEKTRKSMADGFPNLDTLAILPDGDMQVFFSSEKTGEEYLEMGAVDVLSFGPWLIRDGQLNEKGLKKYGTAGGAERVAVGMAEKGHYWFMMLEGRIKRSRGDNVSFLTEKLQEKGCQVAFNLDGGQSACILFMGHQLCKMDDKPHNLSSRRTADILGVGTSELVRTLDDPW